jgi:fused signal recognition particle receptor
VAVEPEVLAAGAAAVAAVVGLIVWLLVRRRRRATGPAVPRPAGEGLWRGLAATRRRLAAQLDTVFGRGPRPLDVMLDELEETLIGADVGVRTTAALLEPLRQVPPAEATPERLRGLLQEGLESMLGGSPAPEATGRPWVILVTGVNGVGKTTTIGKLAARYVAEGRRVLLVAADTFRAAAIDQLAVWAERTGADLVRHAQGADPSAVVFDGLKAALAREVDVVLIDTAGRLHTRTPLMEELSKVARVVGREVPGAPHETLLVVDATTGQNALSQARVFQAAVPLSGLVLTKLDGTARGGVLVAIQNELELPVRYVGVGEGVDDLRPFDAREFVRALFAPETPSQSE